MGTLKIVSGLADREMLIEIEFLATRSGGYEHRVAPRAGSRSCFPAAELFPRPISREERVSEPRRMVVDNPGPESVRSRRHHRLG